MAEEIDDHGQTLTLRTRRGADLIFTVELFADDAETEPVDLTGAQVLSRIFASGQATQVFDAAIGGVDNNEITFQLTAAQTLNMQQDWEYTTGVKISGATTPLLIGFLFVSQEQL